MLDHPKIGIYAGKGGSHSWLWFAEILERIGYYDLCFLDEEKIGNHGLLGLDVLLMSGGDTFAIAEALGLRGAEELERFVRSGGLYVGSCAGAYLPLNSSKRDLNLFNYVNARISNLSRALPEGIRIDEKSCTPYGCSFVFHPVREEVRLALSGLEPFHGVRTVHAPLYGGPAMIGSGEVEVLARYEDFTKKTTFLVDRELARDTVIGKAAALRSRMGSGCFYLFGPHFEHPRFPRANRLLADVIEFETGGRKAQRPYRERNVPFQAKEGIRRIGDFKRELSNSRIAARSMEMMPLRWLIGRKVYEPAKILVFIEAMWDRVLHLERCRTVKIGGGSEGDLVARASEVTVLLRRIKRDSICGKETTPAAEELFGKLKILAAVFLEIYFRTLAGGFDTGR